MDSMGHMVTLFIDVDAAELAPAKHAPGTALPWLCHVCDKPVISPYQDVLVTDRTDVGKVDLCLGLKL